MLFLECGECLVLHLLAIHCLQIESNDKYADSGPPYFILLHPALGPLWEVTRQKVSSQFIFCIKTV